MFSLGISSQTPVLSSTASYFTAHCFAYLQKASLIGQPASAQQALAIAQATKVFRGFLEIQEASSLGYFLNRPPTEDVELVLLATDPDRSPTEHDVAPDQLQILTSHLEKGAVELSGITKSWLNVANLEIRHAEISALEFNSSSDEAFRKLAIQFGQAGLKRKARVLFYDEVLLSSDFRPTGSDSVEIIIRRINKLSDVAVDMVSADLGNVASDFFLQAAELAKDIPEIGASDRFQSLKQIIGGIAKAKLSRPLIESLSGKLQAIIEGLSDCEQQNTLQKQLDELLDRSS